MNRRLIEKIVYIAFSVFGAALWIVITLLDFVFLRDTTTIKYCGIISCFCYSAYAAVKGRRRTLTVLFALLFTLIADFFLLVKNSDYVVGVSAFFVAQCMYMARIYIEKDKFPLVSVCARVAVAAVICVVLFVVGAIDPLTVAVAFYACMLVGNAVESFSLVGRGKNFKIFAIGLCLFVCCDVCVGIYNVGSVLNVGLPEILVEKSVLAAWVFYLPSQIMISLSADEIFS